MNDHETPATSWMTAPIYDALKLLALIILPALGTLYFTLAQIWGLPAANEVVGTIVAVDTFLGVILSYYKKKFDESDEKYQGDIVVTTNAEGVQTYSLNLNGDPAELKDMSQVLFKVQPENG